MTALKIPLATRPTSSTHTVCNAFVGVLVRPQISPCAPQAPGPPPAPFPRPGLVSVAVVPRPLHCCPLNVHALSPGAHVTGPRNSGRVQCGSRFCVAGVAVEDKPVARLKLPSQLHTDSSAVEGPLAADSASPAASSAPSAAAHQSRRRLTVVDVVALIALVARTEAPALVEFQLLPLFTHHRRRGEPPVGAF